MSNMKPIYTLNTTGDVTTETVRLDTQQYSLKLLMKGLLPPEVYSLGQTRPLKVADVGSGTGSWLIDLSKTSPPSWQLDAFDITDAQFAPAETRPPNVRFSFHGILQPFPRDLVETYDIVHVRFMIYVLKAEEWAIAVRNCASCSDLAGFWSGRKRARPCGPVSQLPKTCSRL
jgi:SAM-dependent methyltransferase